MAKFNSSVITNKGRALIAKVQAGTASLQFSKIETGDGSYTGTENLLNVVALKSKKQEFAISSIAVTDSTTVKLRSVITNTNLIEGYYIKEVGLYAVDPDEGIILYSIATAIENQWDYLPAYDSQSPASITMETYSTVSNASSVTISAGLGAAASAEDVMSLLYPEFEDYTVTTPVPSAEVALAQIVSKKHHSSLWSNLKAFFIGTITLGKLANNLLTTVPGLGLDARQGKALKDLIDATNDNLALSTIALTLTQGYTFDISLNYKIMKNLSFVQLVMSNVTFAAGATWYTVATSSKVPAFDTNLNGLINASNTPIEARILTTGAIQIRSNVVSLSAAALKIWGSYITN